MTPSWREHPEARAELIDAVLYLDGQHPGLGDQLLDRLEAVMAGVVGSPDTWPPLRSWTGRNSLRYRSVDPFRLQVICAVQNGSILVIAYAHEGREPGYWRSRLSDRT